MIHLNDVNFVREERHILNQIDLHIHKNEHWVILGKNGSGKTTILEMMTAYEFPSTGTVEVMGNLYGTCDVREVRRKIGYISPSLLDKLNFSDPVWEVVATGEYAFLRFYQQIPDEVVAKAKEMLKRVKLEHVQNQPLGMLSQGERKKVMLARALMQNPAIMIMDEPCAGLDLYEREKLLEDINELGKQNITIVYVTHHIEEITPVFTHVGLLRDGNLVAAGEKREVLTPERLIETFQIPLTIDWHHDRPWIRV